jgi:PAS domain S-box-containing protein
VKPNTLIQRIESKRKLIIQSWTETLGKELPNWTPTSLNQILERLIQELSFESQKSVLSSSDTLRIREHIENVILQIQILRRILFTVLEEESPLIIDERDHLLSLLDGHVNELVTLAAIQHEEKLRNQEWLDLALESSETGAWYWNLKDGRKEIVRNERYDQIMGIKSRAASWNRDEWFKAVHPEDAEETWSKMQAVLSGKASEYDAEYRTVREDGAVRWIHSRAKNIKDSSGKVIRITGIVSDVTDRKLLEQNRNQFISTLSHDIRNPLAAAHSNAQLLEKYPEQIECSKRLLDRIVINIERADGMIQDLLDTSRLQRGMELHLKMAECDLGVALYEVVEELAVHYGDRLRFRTDGEFGGRWAFDALRRVTENLVGNAVKYGDPSSPITIRLSRNVDSVVLSVHNEGNAIPLDEQRTLFEPFRRAQSAEQSDKVGWGLGLTLVKGVAGALGGSIEVESGSEVGTTFRLTFRVRAQSAVA